MRQFALDREHVGQLAIVHLRPQMFVVGGVDQLHVDPHALPFPAHASFQDRPDVQRLSDFAQVVLLSAIRHHRGARDNFQVGDAGEVRQDIVLNAVGEVGVLRVGAKIIERQHRDRFVELPGGRAWDQEVAGDKSDGQTERREGKDIFSPCGKGGRAVGCCDLRRRLNTARTKIKGPR